MKSVFAKHKLFIILFAAFGILTVTVPIALGIGNNRLEGWRVDAGASKAIASNIPLASSWFTTATDTRMIIANTSATAAFFIPTRTAVEFTAFVNNHPAVLGALVYCGNRNCENNFGENVDNCPSDCGHSPETLKEDYYDGYTYINYSVCGDGKCDQGTENDTTCPQDCAVDGCCVSVAPYNIPNCDIYYKSNDHPEIPTVCEATLGCWSMMYQDGIDACIEKDVYDRAWPSYRYELVPSYWPEEKKVHDCWSHTDVNSCTNDLNGSQRNCYWIGQPDTGVSGCSKSFHNNTGTIGADSNYVYMPNDQGYYDTIKARLTYCGDHTCNNSSQPSNPYINLKGLENIYNCPKDCASFSTSTGKIIPTPSGCNVNSSICCGDGICKPAERKGQAGYCGVDCGDIGEGLCRSFETMCPIWQSTNVGWYNMSISTASGFWESCTYSFLNSLASPKDSECNKARTSNICNRFGCFWDTTANTSQKILGVPLCKKYPLNSENQEFIACACGNGTCDSGETCSTCERDCGFCFRTEFCEGSSTACVGKNNKDSCEAISGCKWETP